MTMKKTVLLILSILLSLGLFTSCQQAPPSASTETPPSAPSESPSAVSQEPNETSALPPKFKIGMPDMSQVSTDPVWAALNKQVETLVETCNGELEYLTISNYTPEGNVAMAEEAIAKGCDGFIFTPLTDSVMPTISQMCQESGVYFGSWFRKIQDEEVLGLLEDNPYWCGYTIEKEYDEGYKSTEYLASLGVTKLAFISLQVGDAAGDMREAGMRAAAKDKGIEIVAEARNLMTATDVTKSCQSFIASNQGLDGMLMLSSYALTATEAMAQAIDDAGKTGQIKLGALDMYASHAELFDAGKLDISAGGQHIPDTFLSMASVINFILGTPLDPDGKPNYSEINYFYAYDGDQVREWFKYYGGENGDVLVYTEDEVKELAIKWFNPDLTQQDFYNLGLNWGLEDLKERHGTLE
jgi:ABC-type sugar transport system substrate-binding protein